MNTPQTMEKFTQKKKQTKRRKPNRQQRQQKKNDHATAYKQGFDDGFYWGYRAHQLEREEKDAQLLRGVK